jgi:hypothetical protein
MKRGRVTTQELELGRNVAIHLPFGFVLKTIDTRERCRPA